MFPIVRRGLVYTSRLDYESRRGRAQAERTPLDVYPTRRLMRLCSVGARVLTSVGVANKPSLSTCVSMWMPRSDVVTINGGVVSV